MEGYSDELMLDKFIIKCKSCNSIETALILETVYGEYQGIVIECKECGEKESV